MGRIIVGMLVLLSACVSKGTHAKTLSELDAARRSQQTTAGELDRCKREASEQRAGRDQAEGKLETTSGELAATAAELEELRKIRAEHEKRLAVFKELTSRFQKMIDTGTLRVRVRKGRMLVELPAGVLFAPGKADIFPKAQKALAQVAKILAEIKDRQFLVAGHTDSEPIKESDYADNWALSTARALAVTKLLVASGMKPGSLAAAGYGEFDPVASNRKESGRRQNRRIEIILLPRIDELPKLPES